MNAKISKLIDELSVINNVKIETDENGNQRFTPIEQPKPSAVDNRSWWQKVRDWWNGAPARPYVKIRNLSDPFGDKSYEGGTHSATEIGIKVSF